MNSEKAKRVWKAFCGELLDQPTEDMAQALATAIREIASEYQYYQCYDDQGWGMTDMVVDARSLYELADELDS